jgi:hypothetical protein
MRFKTRIVRSLCFVVPMIAIAAAASPVATISSNSAFELRGKQVNTNGVPSWPMMEGDEISTSQGAAVIQFRDGSRVILTGNTKAKAEKSSDGIVFRLLSGTMDFTLAPKSTVAFFNGSKNVAAQAGVATVVSTGLVGKVAPLRILPPPPPPQSGR